MPDYHAERYEETVRGGGAMIAVRVPSQEVDRTEVEEILTKYHARDFGNYGMAV